ncbi:MAG: UDP-N-acetylglucosamine 2-epimerase [Syntrophomonas sp.]
MKKRKICIITGSRAEYGLLYWLMKDVQEDKDLELQIVATGMHLSPEFGLTYKVIQADGFKITSKVEMLLSSDTSVGIAKSLGLGIIGFADAFNKIQPDIVVLLGDRYEIFAAAQTAMVMKIPIAHISGGDITEGSMDDAIRHSISKMSHLHFVNNEQSAQIVRQLGEDPKNIYNVGSLGIDYINRMKIIPRAKLEKMLDYHFRDKNIMVTFHPVTLSDTPSSQQLQELLYALGNLEDNIGIIFTKCNADAEGRTLNDMIDKFSENLPNVKVFTSLGQLKYLNTMAHMDAIVGNSSSGLTEAPSFHKPTVNIGDRQKGRMLASSVINCPPQAAAIENAIARALKLDCSNVKNPYGDGNSSIQILNILKSTCDYNSLLTKSFNKVKS